jgi:formate C-acetyltransferase
MRIFEIHKTDEIGQMARALFAEEKAKKRLDGWFLLRDLTGEYEDKFPGETSPGVSPSIYRGRAAAKALCYALERIPLSISENALFAGTQADAFSESYALINPSFKVEEFSGYCDPVAIYNDLNPNEEITRERIDAQRRRYEKSEFVSALKQVYKDYANYTGEVAFFMEQVTGHVIPDFREALKTGIEPIIEKLKQKAAQEGDEEKRVSLEAMVTALEGALILAKRYGDLASGMAQKTKGSAAQRFTLMAETLARVPRQGARTLYEAIQSFLLLWQVMCCEQAPNPYAFSVGNADRIFEPFRAVDKLSRKEAAQLFKHFLVFFNVGSRSWAISQNVLVGGKDLDGKDLTNPSTFALLDAYYEMNLPQPILSVKLHKNTPEIFYRELGRFFFTPGCLTPSLFNDDTLFELLPQGGIQREDLPDYSVAGCQEPLIMGKDNGNTTNSWFNLGKILELTLHDGVSSLTGKRILPSDGRKDPAACLPRLRELFYQNAETCAAEMAAAANAASRAVSLLPVPFLSVFMGGQETGRDMRDTRHQGTRYNASGCLIHGLSVAADSFVAVDTLLKERPEYGQKLVPALKDNFTGGEELRDFLLDCPKFGNNNDAADREAAEIVRKISGIVKSKLNYLGNHFRADWSTPSTHLLYGYWVGATPDGRKAREMLNYGVDPFSGGADQGLGFRVLSGMKLPYMEMDGGYASHFGINPQYFNAPDFEGRGIQFRDRVIRPLFFNPVNKNPAPYYLYVNITTPEMLRKVLAEPKKYAPSGVYIMRIHGTFVNFLDLSPAIQEDIIRRLDPASTSLKTA